MISQAKEPRSQGAKEPGALHGRKNGNRRTGDLLLDLAVVLQRLAEHEEQFRAVIARQRHFDLGSTFLDSTIRQRGQFSWIAFTC